MLIIVLNINVLSNHEKNTIIMIDFFNSGPANHININDSQEQFN